MSTFLIIGVAGLLLLGVSLLLGDLFDGALDGLAGDAFSSAGSGGFVAALGFGTAAAQSAGAPLLVAVPAGVVVGGVFAWFAAWLTRVVRGGGSDDTPTVEDVIGKDATVLTDIPENGFGVVRVQIGGHVLRFNARAEQVVHVGTPVHVTGILSPTAVTVAPVWSDLELPPPL